MKKIACVGYHATGSGVIDDLFREFDNVSQGFYEAESQFLQAADGISDLEFHLVECPNRLKTGIVVERFLRYAKDTRRMYEKIFGSEWIKMCENYVEAITKFQFQGYHDRPLIVKKPHMKYVILFLKVINKLTPKKYRKPGWYNYFPHEKEYHACISEREFIQKTRDFVDILCSHIPQNENTDYIVLDQLVPGNAPMRYLRYVRDLKVIVVDRDPRDLYIHHQKHCDHKLPSDPYQFCEYYRDIRRKTEIVSSDDVLYVTFEDMIYKYDEMVKKVMNFVGIDVSHHVSPKSHFNPEVSIKGTQQWNSYPQYLDAVKIIESELPDYLYHYENFI